MPISTHLFHEGHNYVLDAKGIIFGKIDRGGYDFSSIWFAIASRPTLVFMATYTTTLQIKQKPRYSIYLNEFEEHITET